MIAPTIAFSWAGTDMGNLAVSPFPCVFWISGYFFFLHITEESQWLRKWEHRWLIPAAIPCAGSSQQQESACLSFPFPQGKWMVSPGASLASQAHAFALLSLLTPASHGHLGALRRGNLWMLAMDSQPSGEDKTRRLSCSPPHPPTCRIAKLPHELK